MGASWSPQRNMAPSTWSGAHPPYANLCCNYRSTVASSADGGKLFAAVNGGGIYTFQTTPFPSLSLNRSDTNLLLSWIVPSMDFVLQENSDLAARNWIDLTNTPRLNLTNLNSEVTVPLPAGNRFYRLKH